MPLNDEAIEFPCDSCGAGIAFPATEAGSVQFCPNCTAYVDVPGIEKPLRPFDILDHDERLPMSRRVDFADCELSFSFEFGLPHPNWAEFQEQLDPQIDDDIRNTIYNAAARVWLAELVACLPTGYEIWESEDFFLVANSESDVPDLLRFCEETRQNILQIVSIPGFHDEFEKHVVLIIDEPEVYYSYVLHSFPDGEFADFRGICVERGYCHIVCRCGRDTKRIIAHELTHAIVSGLALPRWLDEGLTQVVADSIMNHLQQPRSELVSRMQSHFWKKGLQPFWNGEGFSSPDDGSILCYALAELLVDRLSSARPDAFWSFVAHADWTDAGDSALMQAMGMSLAEAVNPILGVGNWAPELIE